MSDTEILDIKKLKQTIEEFANEREWKQFHNPKNLAMALSVEASELVEIFQWLNFDEASKVAFDPEKKIRVADELSDIIVYAVRMAGILEIDLPKSIESKIAKNRAKYPVELAKGSAKKYNEY